MTKNMKHTILLSLIALVFAGCAEKKEQLRIYIWSEYLDPTIVEDFEKQFNCEVTVDLYEDTDTMMAKMFAGGDSIYDVVFPENPSLPILVSRGMLAPLPKAAIPNLKNIDPFFANQSFNPGMDYGAPYHWGSTGIYMRKPKIGSVEKTLGLLFDPDKQPASFLLLDDMRQTIGMALLYLGHDINTTNPEELSKAADLLIAAKKRSTGFEGAVLASNRVLSKEVNAGVTFGPVAARRMATDPETMYFFPKEGSLLWQDVMSIPSKAPNPEMAAAFINFFLDAEIGARNANTWQVATPNKAAMEYIDSAMLNSPVVYPPAEEMKRLKLVEDVGEHTKLFDELWSKIKSN